MSRMKSTTWSRGTRPLAAGRARRAAALHPLVLLLGCVVFCSCHGPARPAAREPLVARFYLECQPVEPGVTLTLPVSGVAIAVRSRPVFLEFDLAGIAVTQTPLGRGVAFRFYPAAIRDLERLTAACGGRRLVLALNGRAVGVHVIREAIQDGVVTVFVETPDENLPSLVELLRRSTAHQVAASRMQ